MTQDTLIKNGLVIKSPHIDRILAGEKTWELRSRNTQIRGPIALIKSGSGVVSGFAEITDSISPVERDILLRAKDKHGLSADFIQNAIDNSKWKWDHAWVLANPQNLDEHIPYTHAVGAVIWVKFPENEARTISRAYSSLKLG